MMSSLQQSIQFWWH